MSQTLYERSDFALRNRRLFGGHILRNEFILLYSELPEREDDTTIIVAAKNSLYAGYLDFIMLFKEDDVGKIADKESFIDALDAVYCLDSIGDMNLIKYIPEEDDFTKLINSKLNSEKVHVFTEGEIVPELIIDDQREIPAYILVIPGIPTSD